MRTGQPVPIVILATLLGGCAAEPSLEDAVRALVAREESGWRVIRAQW